MDYTLNLNRGDICRVMTAITSLVLDMETEMKSEDCNEYRREHVLPGSIKMWRDLHDEIEKQLDEQDSKQDWYEGGDKS